MGTTAPAVRIPSLRGTAVRAAILFLVEVLLMNQGVIALACIRGNNALARQRAEVVIAAVDAYHADSQRYPTRLEELVPRYLDSVSSGRWGYID